MWYTLVTENRPHQHFHNDGNVFVLRLCFNNFNMWSHFTHVTWAEQLKICCLCNFMLSVALRILVCQHFMLFPCPLKWSFSTWSVHIVKIGLAVLNLYFFASPSSWISGLYTVFYYLCHLDTRTTGTICERYVLTEVK